MKVNRLKHRFVASVPEQIDPGVLYISLDFATMIHLCACGCGREVVTPLSPKDWRMTYDGQSVSVHPSVGRWSLPCRSHYVIKRGKIRWAGDWSDEQIEMGRRADRRRKHGNTPEPQQSTEQTQKKKKVDEQPGLLRKLWAFLSKTS